MTTVAPKAVFFGLLRDEFAPQLRRVGFKGSGQNFLRVRGDVINAINIQGNKYGGSVAVNLGLHLAFLPLCWSEEAPDLATIKEVDCEFRRRLAPGRRQDYWWKYGGFFSVPLKRARHLVKTYFDVGEPLFERFDTVQKIADGLTVDSIRPDEMVELFGPTTSGRAALTMARINRHIGRNDKARAFAAAGLDNMGSVQTLKPALERLLAELED